MTNIIAVVNQKGGVGKTIVTCNCNYRTHEKTVHRSSLLHKRISSGGVAIRQLQKIANGALEITGAAIELDDAGIAAASRKRKADGFPQCDSRNGWIPFAKWLRKLSHLKGAPSYMSALYRSIRENSFLRSQDIAQKSISSSRVKAGTTSQGANQLHTEQLGRNCKTHAK